MLWLGEEEVDKNWEKVFILSQKVILLDFNKLRK